MADGGPNRQARGRGFVDTLRNARRMVASAWRRWAPPEQLSTREWAERYRYLSAESSAEHGKYDIMRTPWVIGIMDAIDDPAVAKVVNMKASQTAWTDGVLVNYILRRIDTDPCGMVGMFAKTQAADEFVEEKLAPAVRATPRMHGLIDVDTTRKAGQKKLYKKFAGGFLKLVGSNSPSSVKSTSAPVVFIEEPDDANTNIKGQGDTIKLLEDRTKTFEDRKIIYGGTPTTKGLSAIEDAYLASDQRKYFVACHDCGDAHVLDWDNVRWDETADIEHEIYGRAVLDSAVYCCPHCGSIWDDEQKFRNVVDSESNPSAGWRATAEFNGTAGFGYISELYVGFHASRLSELVRRYLEAQHKLKQGDETDWIAFVNTCLGLPYEFGDDRVDQDELRARAQDYAELSVPSGGLVMTAGVDVQHDRLAIVLRAWGRGEESWLVYWGEIAAGNAVVDHKDPVWGELERVLFTPRPSADGFEVPLSALTIDSSDGQTNDAVYAWVRRMQRKYPQVKIMAGKGASSGGAEKEIYSLPRRSIDHRTPTKAQKHGLRVHLVGTHKAKDLIAARLQLVGHGPGRMHWYESVRADYYDQITAEVLAPSRRRRGQMEWQLKSGQRNEALDCEVYALHASRAVRVHLMTPERWAEIERERRQTDLFTPKAPTATAHSSAWPSDDSDGSDGFGTVEAGSGWL